jgi:multisubunit Na+/H+ antiporter MnhB subunit
MAARKARVVRPIFCRNPIILFPVGYGHELAFGTLYAPDLAV